MESYTIRRAEPSDVPQVHSIYEHYILNTVTNFYQRVPPLSKSESGYHTTKNSGLPYLVAVKQEPESNSNTIVLGYAYASPFRGPKLAYAPTVELTIFIHPSHQSGGIGTRLINDLLDELSHTVLQVSEPGHEDQKHDVPVQNVMAVMSYDINGPGKDNGDKLRAWYQKLGFEAVGHLKNVGWKFDRWLDTMYLQLQLDQWRRRRK